MLPVLGAVMALIGSAAVAGSAPVAYYPSLGYGQGGPAYDDGPGAYDDGPEAYVGEPARGPDGIRQAGPGAYVDDPAYVGEPVHGPNLIRPAPGPSS